MVAVLRQQNFSKNVAAVDKKEGYNESPFATLTRAFTGAEIPEIINIYLCSGRLQTKIIWLKGKFFTGFPQVQNKPLA